MTPRGSRDRTPLRKPTFFEPIFPSSISQTLNSSFSERRDLTPFQGCKVDLKNLHRYTLAKLLTKNVMLYACGRGKFRELFSWRYTQDFPVQITIFEGKFSNVEM